MLVTKEVSQLVQMKLNSIKWCVFVYSVMNSLRDYLQISLLILSEFKRVN